jgi:hypothetical protein
MAVLGRFCGMALDAYKKNGRKWGDIKADEGMITFSEAFGRGYIQKERTTYL